MANAVAIEEKHSPNYLNATKGIWSWMTTVDHKRIGVMYLISVMSAFMVGGIFALLLATRTRARSRLTASRGNAAVPEPSAKGPASVVPASDAIKCG